MHKLVEATARRSLRVRWTPAPGEGVSGAGAAALYGLGAPWRAVSGWHRAGRPNPWSVVGRILFPAAVVAYAGFGGYAFRWPGATFNAVHVLIGLIVACSAASWFVAATWVRTSGLDRESRLVATSSTFLSGSVVALLVGVVLAAAVALSVAVLVAVLVFAYFGTMFGGAAKSNSSKAASAGRRNGPFTLGDVVWADMPYEDGVDEFGRTHKDRPVTVLGHYGDWYSVFYMTSQIDKRASLPGWFVVWGPWSDKPSAIDANRTRQVHCSAMRRHGGRLSAPDLKELLRIHGQAMHTTHRAV